MPSDDVVLAIRNILDLVAPAGIGLGEVGSGADNDIARHLRVDVAKQWHYTRGIELEGLLVALGPCTEVVSVLLVAADRGPEHVVLHVVAVLEVNRRPDLNDRDVRTEHQAFLVDQRFRRGGWKCLSLNSIDVNNGFSG